MDPESKPLYDVLMAQILDNLRAESELLEMFPPPFPKRKPLWKRWRYGRLNTWFWQKRHDLAHRIYPHICDY